jgi:hypothetical protein
MIALLFSSIFSFFLFLVFSAFIAKFIKLQTDFAQKALIGLVVSNTITTFVSLFAPINIYVLIGLILGCSILMIFALKELKSLLFLLKSKRIIILFALPFILIATIVTINAPQNYDTGLYHLQSIKWIEEFAVVPGLANLHGRFGFNPNIFTFFALTSLFELFKQEIFSVNFTLFSVFVLYFINKLYSTFTKNGITNIFIFNLIIFITILNLSGYLSSPSPDFISITFPLFILSSFYKGQDWKENLGIMNFIPILILCVYVVTVKLSTLPIVILPIFIFLKFKTNLRELFQIFFLLSLIILPWFVRNVVLTGWLVYPMYSIDLFNFDWKVPVSSLKSMNEAVTGWARNPGEQYVSAAHMDISEWFPSWWHRLIRKDKLLLLSSFIFPLVSFIGFLTRKIKIDFHTIVIIFTSFIGVIFWLLLGPDFRFGKGFIIIASISPILYLNFKLKLSWFPYKKLIFIFLVMIIILFLFFAKKNTGYNVIGIAQENSNRIITPQIIEIPKSIYFKTYDIGGIEIHVPSDGDQCFNHCLPCTPYPDSTLELRNNTLQSGFKHNDINTLTK